MGEKSWRAEMPVVVRREASSAPEICFPSDVRELVTRANSEFDAAEERERAKDARIADLEKFRLDVLEAAGLRQNDTNSALFYQLKNLLIIADAYVVRCCTRPMTEGELDDPEAWEAARAARKAEGDLTDYEETKKERDIALARAELAEQALEVSRINREAAEEELADRARYDEDVRRVAVSAKGVSILPGVFRAARRILEATYWKGGK